MATPPTAQQQQNMRSIVQNLFALLIAVVVIGVAAYLLVFREATPDAPPLTSDPFVVNDPQPIPQSILTDQIIFYDSFEDQSIQWSLSALGQTRYEGGALILRDNHYEGISSARPRLALENFVVEVYTRWLSGAFGGDYGLRFRQTGNEDYYAFYIRNDGRYVVSKQIDGDWFEVASAFTPAIDRSGGVNLLRVEALDKQLRFFVNGQYLVDVTTEMQNVGDFELVAIRPDGTEWLEVAFDNFLVAQHPEQTNTAVSEPPIIPLNNTSP